MEAFSEYRIEMVERQLVARGIHDPLVLKAMREVPRHIFTGDHPPSIAYGDFPLSIGFGQTISQPFMVAVMSEHVRVSPGMNVLEIGTGSGYQAAVLSAMGAKVVTIERIAALHERAKTACAAGGYRDIEFHVGDGTTGFAAAAPYDRIIVTAGAPRVPEPLMDQLIPGGIIVVPVGGRYLQQLHIIERQEGRHIDHDGCECVFVSLIGEYGWKE